MKYSKLFTIAAMSLLVMHSSAKGQWARPLVDKPSYKDDIFYEEDDSDKSPIRFVIPLGGAALVGCAGALFARKSRRKQASHGARVNARNHNVKQVLIPQRPFSDVDRARLKELFPNVYLPHKK